MPSRFSSGASSLAALVLRSSPVVNEKDAFLLAGSSLPSESSSRESLSKSPGYLSCIDLVGLTVSGFFVTVRARPFSSIVSMTEAR